MKISNQIKPNFNSGLKKVQDNNQNNFKKLSSGKKINSAKDDPAGLAISNNLQNLTKALDMSNQNISFSSSALNTADGGLGNISDNLQRIRSLAITSSSSLLNKEDRNMIQEEINDLIGGINDIANNTQFNGKNLLNGDFKNMNTASNPNGSGINISINSLTTDFLGISNFDVTGEKIDLSSIDKALNTVSSSRANIGATSNRLGYTHSSNSNTSLNIKSAKSKIEDADIAKTVSDKEKDKALSQYNLYLIKSKQNVQLSTLNILF